MISKFISVFDSNRETIKELICSNPPDSYKDLFTILVRVLKDNLNEYDAPDPERIVEIDHGSYQGTLLFIVGAGGYQPDEYWVTRVSYGSCSGCDTFLSIQGYSNDELSNQQVDDYFTLILHMLQGMKEI